MIWSLGFTGLVWNFVVICAGFNLFLCWLAGGFPVLSLAIHGVIMGMVSFPCPDELLFQNCIACLRSGRASAVNTLGHSNPAAKPIVVEARHFNTFAEVLGIPTCFQNQCGGFQANTKAGISSSNHPCLSTAEPLATKIARSPPDGTPTSLWDP